MINSFLFLCRKMIIKKHNSKIIQSMFHCEDTIANLPINILGFSNELLYVCCIIEIKIKQVRVQSSKKLHDFIYMFTETVFSQFGSRCFRGDFLHSVINWSYKINYMVYD